MSMTAQGDSSRISNLKANFISQKARYVKIVAPIFEKIPEWHYAAEQPTFLFVDEIIIN